MFQDERLGDPEALDLDQDSEGMDWDNWSQDLDREMDFDGEFDRTMAKEEETDFEREMNRMREDAERSFRRMRSDAERSFRKMREEAEANFERMKKESGRFGHWRWKWHDLP